MRLRSVELSIMPQTGHARPSVAHGLGIDVSDDDARFGSTFRENLSPWPHDQRMAVGLPAIGVRSALSRGEDKAPFSMARARSRTCQCAFPVVSVNALGTAEERCARLCQRAI